MKDIIANITANVLTALYQPFWFSVALSVLALFFYLFAYHNKTGGRGLKAAFSVWWKYFREDLSAKSEDTDKILGLSMGADDYVTKPFNPQELAARVRSQLRRYTLLGDVHAEERQGLIVNGRLTYDPDRRELRADGEAVKLTATETKIVDLLMRNPGRIFPAEEIYRRVWDGEAAYACENTVMVHIRRIREKIELNPKEPEYLKVVWGIGYKMEKIAVRR